MYKLIRQPLFWFSILFLIWGMFRTMSLEQPKYLSADGRGYYFYLPAIFIQGDPTYEATFEAESKYYQHSTQYHIFQDKDGNHYDKFFPGIAVLESPFFGLACIVSYLTGEEVNGFSPTFGNFFFLGYFIYTLLGLVLFVKCAQIMYPDGKWYAAIAIAAFFATPLLYYSFEIVLSHNFTFFLFGLFTFLLLKLKQEITAKRVFLLGLVLGLIIITRPTNALVVLITPFILGGLDETRAFFTQLFSQRGKLLFTGILGVFLMLFVLFSIWKWQSGHWIYWPYKGEGFNWGNPRIFENLFSFRIGLFLHTPLIILAIIGLFADFRKKYFANSFFLIYFLVITYVISAWWCWDYESTYGNRPYIEHTFFLLLPLIGWVRKKGKLLLPLIGLCALLGIIRYGEYLSDFMVNQRFTASNYIESLAFWKKENKGRWTYNITCQPYGDRIVDKLLIDQPGITHFDAGKEFALESHQEFLKKKGNYRYFIRVSFAQKSLAPLDDVIFVIDTESDNPEDRYYCAIPVYDDRLAGIGKWDDVLIEWAIPNNLSVYKSFKCYVWNKAKRTFDLKDFKVNYEVYEVKD